MLRAGGLSCSGQSALQQRLSADGSARACRGFSLLGARHAVAAFKCTSRSDGGAAKGKGRGKGKRSTAEHSQAELALLLPAGLLPTRSSGRSGAGGGAGGGASGREVSPTTTVSLVRGYLFVRRPAADHGYGCGPQQSWTTDWTPPRKSYGARGSADAAADGGGLLSGGGVAEFVADHALIAGDVIIVRRSADAEELAENLTLEVAVVRAAKPN